MSDPRYPVGVFEPRAELTPALRDALIAGIANAPAQLRAAITGLSPEQLDTAYRAGGWTVRQVIHHVADSHLNACIRTRWALTEAEPLIKAYDEKLWAELPDACTADPQVSLDLLTTLHQRWVLLWQALTPADFSRTMRHPESGVITVDRQLQLYEWHGRHHTAHITTLRQQNGW